MNKFRHTSLVLMILLTFIFGGVYAYGMYTINTTSKRVHDLSKELADRTQETQSMKHLKELTNDASDRKQKLLAYTVQPDQTVKFVELVESETQSSGATTTIIGINVTDSTSIADLESLSLDVQSNGLWHDVVNVLTTLESLPYKINISHVNLQANGSNSDDKVSKESQWGAAISFSVLKQKDVNPTQ